MINDPRDTDCALSGLSIPHGAPVLVIPLARVTQKRGAPCIWAPLSPPVKGTYDASHHGALNTEPTPGSLLCSRTLGFARVDALIEAARAGHIKEPKRQGALVDTPSWQTTGVALIHPRAWTLLLDMPVRVGSSGFEPSGTEGSLAADLSRAAGETVIWTRAAVAAIEHATGRSASKFPPAARLADRDARLLHDFTASAVYMSKDLPKAETFDAIFGSRAKAGLSLYWHGLESKTEHLAMLTLPRMGFSDAEVEAAAFELCALAGAHHAWHTVLGRRWAPSRALLAGRPSPGAQWLWADKVRDMALDQTLVDGPGDPHVELTRARMDRAQIDQAATPAPSRARGPTL